MVGDRVQAVLMITCVWTLALGTPSYGQIVYDEGIYFVTADQGTDGISVGPDAIVNIYADQSGFVQAQAGGTLRIHSGVVNPLLGGGQVDVLTGSSITVYGDEVLYGDSYPPIATAPDPIPGGYWWVQGEGTSASVTDIDFFVSTATGVDIDLAPINILPVAVDDDATLVMNQSVTIDVLGNDTDDDVGDDALFVVYSVSVTSTEGGTVENLGDGVLYTPPVGFEGTDTFTYTMTDTKGQSEEGTVTVSPAARPEIISVAADITDPVEEGTTVTITTIFEADPGDPVGAVITWGDGQTAEQSNVTSPLAIDHPYSAAGVYTVTMMLTNSGGSSTSSYEYVVVYDPTSGAFVTGAGWIPYEGGACDKAFFGFLCRSVGGGTPAGRMRFRWGENRFRATSFDWLVTDADGTGTTAWFAGHGAVNGSDGYDFMVQINDADNIWIAIFDEYNDEYNTDDLVSLGGGRIRIRTRDWE
jgi:Big-like domain-containing protein/PKD domain-containing protein